HDYKLEEDMLQWLENERQRHLILVLERIKQARCSASILSPRPMIPQTVVSPESPRRRPPPTPDPEWRPPVQSKPPPSTSFLSSAHLDTSTCFSSAFRKGVNLTPHAKPYLAQACKDVRVLRRSVYAQAAHARNHVAAHMVLSSSPPKGLPGDSIEDAAVATPDEVDAALLQYQRDVERRLRRHSAINQ
ncbi:hypothetical protein DYB28_015491, partial [Aphanomyces astaci]